MLWSAKWVAVAEMVLLQLKNSRQLSLILVMATDIKNWSKLYFSTGDRIC